MTHEHDPRPASRHRERATESRSAMAIAASASASASASLSILDIPAIVRRRAASPRDAESSGLVDVTELCFGDGLSRAPITPLLPIAADPEPARRIDRERALLWSMTAAAAIAVAAMFAVAIGHRPAPVILRAHVEPAPTMAAADRVGARDERPVDEHGAAIAPIPPLEDDDDDESHDASSIDPEPVATPSVTTRGGSTRSRAPKPSKPSSPSASSASQPGGDTKPPRITTPAPKGETSVECVLDPASCGLGGGASKPAPPPPVAAPEALPDKLSTAALRAVLGPAKSSAQTCGPRHAAASGTQVQVKLSITGSTGRVLSATPLGDHAGTALGKCVADALAAPVFPRFSAASQGVVWPVRL